MLAHMKCSLAHGAQQKWMRMEHTSRDRGIGEDAARHALWRRVAIAFFLSHIKELLTVLVQCMTQKRSQVLEYHGAQQWLML